MPVKKRIIGLGGFMLIAAAFVVIGLLFKIQHWEYASTFITIGLGAEAVLFVMIGIFIFKSAFHKQA